MTDANKRLVAEMVEAWNSPQPLRVSVRAVATLPPDRQAVADKCAAVFAQAQREIREAAASDVTPPDDLLESK
jgi:hypothetical protein